MYKLANNRLKSLSSYKKESSFHLHFLLKYIKSHCNNKIMSILSKWMLERYLIAKVIIMAMTK